MTFRTVEYRMAMIVAIIGSFCKLFANTSTWSPTRKPSKFTGNHKMR